ncbi:MAG TPA: UvrD-helicase domain-containing protein [Gemmatimonadaceae bacterium]|nr:UvrD-helicase domain-containing protein [Gemmatimonadaceae bacterium]
MKTTAFDLQMDPANPGMHFHRLDKGKDRRFWSVRVSGDIRLIVHRTAESLLLCYVDHHDKAYAWAERRKLETHPTTGAAQFVEIREHVQEMPARVFAVGEPAVIPYLPGRGTSRATRTLFAAMSDSELLAYGVPPEWLADARMATEDSLLTLADHLPAEAAEALLELATGGAPRVTHAATRVPLLSRIHRVPEEVVGRIFEARALGRNPFDHPDALRRFRVVANVDELAHALEYPWERWIVFLHPAQRALVEKSFAGPARVSGSAGTGKTIVALHRAVFLGRQNPDARVLLTTLSETLANSLRVKLARLIGTQPRLRERIDVESLDAVARRLGTRMLGDLEVASHDLIRDLVRDAAAKAPNQKFALTFLVSEWENVVDAWQLDTWEAYRDVARLGRKTRLPGTQRKKLWEIFEHLRESLRARNLVTMAEVYGRLTAHIAAREVTPYEFIVVDEAQDVSVSQLRLVALLGGGRPDALFFAGDLGQRIFQVPFSWKSLGVDIGGRSVTLRTNYRTSHQIRAKADRLLGSEVSDMDGNVERRVGTISEFNGPEPQVLVANTAPEELGQVSGWLSARAAEGVTPGEIAIFVRSEAELARATAAVKEAGLAFALLDEGMRTNPDRVSVGVMHLSKGLEFRAVAVMACDDEVLPLQSRIEEVSDEGDLEDVYDTERHLLYVACTRARDHLLITGVSPASEFLDDLTDGADRGARPSSS